MNDIFKVYDFENEQQWLKGRMNGIGGSDASAVVGMNPYKSNIDLLSELSEAIEIGLDIEFILYGERYNISWRDDEPFICRCPEGETNFYTDAKAMLDKHKINDKQLKELWNDMKVLSM